MPPTYPSISSAPISWREWLIALLVALGATILFILPYLLGHALVRPGTVYTGILNNVEDGTYLSAIQQGREGNWTYRNLFTNEPHSPAFIEGFYLAVGHMGRLFNLSTVASWHLALALSDLILFLVLYGFLALFLKTQPQRFVAYLLSIFGAGFDWWEFPTWFERANTLEAVPIDRFMPEAHIFYSALTFPHFIAGITLILVVFWWLLRAMAPEQTTGRGWLLAGLAGIANILLGVVYPFLILLPATVLGLYFVYLLWQAKQILWRAGFKLLLAFLLPLPLYLYYVVVIANNAVMRAWNDQAITLSPNPLHFLLTYVPYLLLGLWTLRGIVHRPVNDQGRLAFLWLWILSVAVLLYLPINPQRRFVEGVQVPLAILATWGLFETVLPRLMQTAFVQRLLTRPNYHPAGVQRLLLLIIILGVSLFNLYLLLGAVTTLGFIQPYPQFRPQAEIEAMAWLKENSHWSDSIMSSYWSGSYIPSQSGNVVFVGHIFETVNFAEKEELANLFFTTQVSDAWRQEILAQNNISFVFYGPHERALGNFNPETATFLDNVYQAGDVILFRFRNP